MILPKKNWLGFTIFKNQKKSAIKRRSSTAIWLKCKWIFTLLLINWAKCHIRQLRQGWPINWALFFPQSFCIVYTYPLIFDDALNFQTRFPIYVQELDLKTSFKEKWSIVLFSKQDHFWFCLGRSTQWAKNGGKLSKKKKWFFAFEASVKIFPQ